MHLEHWIRKAIRMNTLVWLACLLLMLSHDSAPIATAEKQPRATADVPAYHPGPPEETLAPVLDPNEFNDALVQNAYRVASRIKEVLYQQPCYCYCDRHAGHRSLLDCYTTKHTVGCHTCLQELFYVYEQTVKGQSALQIRESIIHGGWKAVDLTKYQQPMPES